MKVSGHEWRPPPSWCRGLVNVLISMTIGEASGSSRRPDALLAPRGRRSPSARLVSASSEVSVREELTDEDLAQVLSVPAGDHPSRSRLISAGRTEHGLLV